MLVRVPLPLAPGASINAALLSEALAHAVALRRTIGVVSVAYGRIT